MAGHYEIRPRRYDASIYRLAVSRPTHYGSLTVAEYRHVLSEWKSRPWWRRFHGKPADEPVRVANEHVDGFYDDLSAAENAAEKLARDLVKEKTAGAGVAILDSDGHEVGGRWPNGDWF